MNVHFGKSWTLKSFGWANTNGFVLTSTLKCLWEKMALTLRKLSRNVLHIRIGCLRHLGNQIVAKHMTQTRTRGQTHDSLCGYPWRLPHGLMLMFSYFLIKFILCNCQKIGVPLMLEGTGFSIKIFFCLLSCQLHDSSCTDLYNQLALLKAFILTWGSLHFKSGYFCWKAGRILLCWSEWTSVLSAESCCAWLSWLICIFGATGIASFSLLCLRRMQDARKHNQVFEVNNKVNADHKPIDK